MRLVTKIRNLSPQEKQIAKSVFADSLPSYSRILITDGLGPIPSYDNPYADKSMLMYHLNLGPDIYPDATKVRVLRGFGRYRDIFIHELTHVWQYYRDYQVVLSSLWANLRKSDYSYKVGKAWDDYDVEQQAKLVEDWYSGGMSVADDRFVYIDKIIRPGVGGGFLKKWMDVIKIRATAKELAKFR